jgi:hypothetical protein
VRTSDHTISVTTDLVFFFFSLGFLTLWGYASSLSLILSDYIRPCASSSSIHTHTHTHTERKKRERERDQMLVTDRFPSPYFSFLFFLIFFSVSSSSTWIVGCRISFLPLFSLSLLFQDSTNPSQTHTQTHWWVGISKMKYTHTQTDKPSVVVSIPQFPLFMGSAPISSSRTGNAFKFDRIG